MNGVDYSHLPLTAKFAILEGYFSALRKPTPREQISCTLALAFGMVGLEPNGVAFEDYLVDDSVKDAVSEICDEAADAVLDVLARHGATFREAAP